MAMSEQCSPRLGFAQRMSAGFQSLRKSGSLSGSRNGLSMSPTSSATSSPLLRRVQMARLKCLMRSPKAKRISPLLQMDNSQSSEVSNSHYESPQHSPITMRKQDVVLSQPGRSSESLIHNAPLAATHSSRITTDSSSSGNEEVSTDIGTESSSHKSALVDDSTSKEFSSSSTSPLINRPRPASTQNTLSPSSQPSDGTSTPTLDFNTSDDGATGQSPNSGKASTAGPHSAPILRNASGTSGSIFLLAQHRANRRYLSYPLGDSEEKGSIGDIVGLKDASFAFQEVREVVVGRGEQDEKYGLKVDRIGNGVYLTMIQRGSMASSAGLKVGDQLIRVNDRPVSRMTLDEVVNCFKHCQVAVKLAYKPRSVITRTREVHLRKCNGLLGVRLQRRADGIYIDVVIPNSPASQAGLKDGDQILTINGDSVTRWSQERTTRRLKETPDEMDMVMEIREMLPMANMVGGGAAALPPTSSRPPSVGPAGTSSTNRPRSRFQEQWSGVAMSEPNSPMPNSRGAARSRTSSSSISRSESPATGRHRRTSERAVSQQLTDHDTEGSKNRRPSNQLFEDASCSVASSSVPTVAASPTGKDAKWNVQNLSFNPQISYV